MEHNPYLQPWQRPEPNNVAGKGQIETPGQARNIVWQTRAAPPTAYENSLGDAFEQAFESGAQTLEELVQCLNAAGLRTPAGQAWSVTGFATEIARLGA